MRTATLLVRKGGVAQHGFDDIVRLVLADALIDGPIAGSVTTAAGTTTGDLISLLSDSIVMLSCDGAVREQIAIAHVRILEI